MIADYTPEGKEQGCAYWTVGMPQHLEHIQVGGLVLIGLDGQSDLVMSMKVIVH